MTYPAFRHIITLLIIGLFVATGANAAEQKLTVDDMEVYYGIVPAEIVKKQANKETGAMHDGQSRKRSRHLVVALFDTKSRQRISDASVAATVTPLGLAPNEKRLEQMRIDDTITYGSYFDFPAESAPFRIELKIGRPNRPTQSASFEYRP